MLQRHAGLCSIFPRLGGTLLSLAAIMLLTILLVPPRGDFPLNDDWTYAQSVEGILAEGHFTPHPFATAILVLQAYWGALFASIFGFSFTILRASTLVLALLGAWASAACARVYGLPRAIALLVGALTLANPIAMNLSYTFMTDVPFAALAACSAFFYLRSLKDPGEPSPRLRTPVLPAILGSAVLWGSLFAALAFLIRQFGVLLPAAYLLARAHQWYHGRGGLSRAEALAFAAPWLIAAALASQLPLLVRETGHVWNPRLLGASNAERLAGGLRFLFTGLCYMGLFLWPLALLRFFSRERRRITARFSLLAASLALAALLICRHPPYRMPLLHNVLYDFGTGPMTLRGLWVDDALWRPLQWGAWWWPITALCLAIAALLFSEALVLLFPRRLAREDAEEHPPDTQDIFLLCWGLLTILSLFNPWLPVRFDRYFIAAQTPWALLLVRGLRKHPAGERPFSRRGLTAACLGCAALYIAGLCGLQDYMAWNRARWDALARLQTDAGAPPETIDGGFEFNGRYTSGAYIERIGGKAFFHQGPLGWWVVEDRFAVSFLPREGFEIIGREPYFSWLGMEERDILILRRDGPTER